MLDKLTYPRYEPRKVYSYKKHPTKEDMPYLLEHVFDLETGEYITDSSQCCYYNPLDTMYYLVESMDSNIVSVDGTDLIADGVGKTRLIITDTLNESSFKINVIVYRKNFNHNLMKQNLVLQQGTVIDLDYVLKHVHCTHYDDCLFHQDRLIIKDTELEYLIKSIKKEIEDYNNIITSYRNGEIIYHPHLDDYYNIQILHEDNGSCKTNVTVKKGFISHIKSEIKRLQVELRDYMRMC